MLFSAELEFRTRLMQQAGDMFMSTYVCTSLRGKVRLYAQDQSAKQKVNRNSIATDKRHRCDYHEKSLVFGSF